MNTDTYKDERYYRVANFYIAAFLFANGQELSNIDRTDSRKSLFVFRDTPEREHLVQSFNFSPENDPTVQIDARKFVMAIKMLKDKLYQVGS